MRVAQPDEVYNLGAVTFVEYSWRNPRVTTEVTAGGVLNLLEAVRLGQERTGTPIRMYQASSAEMFGRVQRSPNAKPPLLWPRSPYGVARPTATT